MATPLWSRSLICTAERLKLCPELRVTNQRRRQYASQQAIPQSVQDEISQLRLPRAVQATYLAPLKRRPSRSNATSTCDLQLRSYSVRNLELFADFALRAAYYLNLPASGPVPLPQIRERWTVPRSNFIFKKSQENFERRTTRRLIQIQEGHPEVVSIWLAFLKKYQYFGVGMKANVFEHSDLNVAEDQDKEAERIADKLGEKLTLAGRSWTNRGIRAPELMEERLLTQPFKGQWGAYAPMGGAASVPSADKRIAAETVRGEKS